MEERELTEEEITEAYKRVAETDAGKIVFDDLRESFYDIQTYNPHTPDKDKALWMEGCRWVVGYVLDQLKHVDPDKQDNPRNGSYL